MTKDGIAGVGSARRGRTSMRGALLAGLLALAGGCDEDAKRVPTPTGKAEGEVVFHNDGVIEVDAIVSVQVFSDGDPQTYTLGEVRISDTTGAADWIIDEIELEEGGWPVTADGLLDFESRRIRVKAHASPEGMVTDPFVEVDLVRNGDAASEEGEVLPAFLTRALETRFDACEVPAIAPVPEALGGALAWSTETLPGVVDAFIDLAVDPLGRTFFATNFASSPRVGIRVFGAAPGGFTSIIELDGEDAAIAPGNGSGPIIASVARAPDFTLTQTISRRDAELHAVWSREISNLADGSSPVVATSGGMVLVSARPYAGLVIDGVAIPEAGDAFSMLVLFDATTGDYVGSRAVPAVMHVSGAGSGAFAITTTSSGGQPPTLTLLEPDLTPRWSVPLEEEPRGLATTRDGHLWVDHVYDVARYAPDGALVARIEAPLHESFAPLDDAAREGAGPSSGGSVLVGGSDFIARVAADQAPSITTVPDAVAAWCRATSAFHVASGEGGPVFAAKPLLNTPSGFEGLAIFGGLAL